METTIARIDLGAGGAKALDAQDLTNRRLEDVQGKEVNYRGCDFSYSVVVRGYFHKATFVKCKFVGTRFVSSAFRSATFEDCDFSYADFDRCVVPISQVLANLPPFPNVRWELLHNLRANAKTLGDTQHESEIVWKEIDTEMEHWRSISQGQSGYYRNKYDWKDRFLARLRRWRLLTERYAWGHGESLVRLGVATLVALAVIAAFNALGGIEDFGSVSLPSIGKRWFESFQFVGALFVDLPSVSSADVSRSLITSTLAVALRYVSIGLAVPVLYKYIAKR